MASDLHTHTNYSDGFFSPEVLAAKAKQLGFKYLAITDHDTVDGVKHLKNIGGMDFVQGIKIIPGVEISAEHPGDGYDLHIVGLNLDITNKKLLDKLEGLSDHRQDRLRKMIALLNEQGYKITLKDVFDTVGEKKIVVRKHLALTLARKGFFPTSHDAYQTLLKHGKPAYVPLKHLSVDESIDLIHSAGGIAVLAHPKLVKDDKVVDEIAKKFDAIEVYYPQHSYMDVQRYLAIADKYNLKISGGSDFHGTPEDRKHPKTLGAYTIPDGVAENLFAK